VREILSRTVFETCLADQSEAPWEEEVRMLLAHDAALRAEVERLRAERDGAFTRYDALLWQIANEGCVSARVGEGTRECGLPVCGLCRLVHDRDFYRENSAALGHALEIGNAKIEDLRALLLEVAEGGVEFEDPRVRYVAVQIDADTWARVKALTAPAEEAEREERRKEKGEV
jgi:hypothetical protein